MKKLLLVIILAVSALTMTAQTELTVCDGTVTNAYVPFCGFGNMDGDQNTQMIYPAAALSELNGCKITAIVFYPKDKIDWSTINTWSMAEVEQASFAGSTLLEAGATEVAKVKGDYDDAKKTWTITLDAPYTYNGGNLLIQGLMPKDYNGNKTFYGASQADVTALTNYNDMGFGYEVQKSKFLPKMTIVYESAEEPLELGETVLIEDFESYTDVPFSTVAVGNWTYVDADSYITYANPGMTAVPNAGTSMAFQLVDTNDDRYSAYYTAHSGTHFLLAPRCRDGVDNNDWLISPELNLSKGGKLTFWAVGGTGYADFEVLASTTNTDLTSFTAVGETVNNLGGSWTQFSYELPAGTKHFAIHHMTDSWSAAVIFGVDDIEVKEYVVATSVEELPALSPKAYSNAVYNLAGQRVGANQKGLVIMNGKKYFVK